MSFLNSKLVTIAFALFAVQQVVLAADNSAPQVIPTQLRPAISNTGQSSPSATSAEQASITRPDIAPFIKGQAIYLVPSKEQVAPQAPFTLYTAAVFAMKNYPKILQAAAEARAAQKEVTLQKVREYNPQGLMSYQQVVATHNKLTQLLFASPVLPPNPGPGLDSVSMNPSFFSGTGFLFDWAPLDFGLHKARIQESKANWKVAQARYASTQLDVAMQASSAFLTAVIAYEEVRAAEANVQRFQDFSRVVHSLVDADLKPAADASLADAQLANSKNDLIRAQLHQQLALADVANALGLAGQDVKIDPGKIALVSEPADLQKQTPVFEYHPYAIEGKAVLLREAARMQVLKKQYYPVFRWLGGMNFRGSSLDVHGREQSANAYGFATAVPNWNVGLVVDFQFMDIIRINAEKKVVSERIQAEQHSYNLILQNLRTQDVKARARVEAAVALAANMPVQVAAAYKASRQAQARYESGLGTVAQVAEANQVLAESRLKEAVAKVGVWQSLLDVAAVHSDFRPFLDEANRLETR